MKILINATPSFHKQYHLSFVINDIKPEFTLGGIEAKINQIVKELKDRNEYSKNLILSTPLDFTKCAVIAPFGAAGLGDFKKKQIFWLNMTFVILITLKRFFKVKRRQKVYREKLKILFLVTKHMIV
jgi:hypothetical protein